MLCIGNQEQVLTRQEYFAFIYAKDKKKTRLESKEGGKAKLVELGLGISEQVKHIRHDWLWEPTCVLWGCQKAAVF